MGYNRFNLLLILRVLLLTLFIAGTLYLVTNTQLWFTAAGAILLTLLLIYDLIHYVNRTNKEISKFLYALKYEDYSINFSLPKWNKNFRNLENSLNEIIQRLNNVRIEKEAHYELFQNLLTKIHVGLIVVSDTEEIILMNPAAQNLLNIPQLKTLDRLGRRQPIFVSEIKKKHTGGRQLIKLDVAGKLRELSVDVSNISIQEAKFKLISFQDIKDEIEQKELDAWLRLIKILTHEIMNSVTPLNSLTSTLITLLHSEDDIKKAHEVDDETLEDIYEGLITINRRSKGMMSFVKDYRKLTQIPPPKIAPFSVMELFEDIGSLMKAEFYQRQVNFEIDSPNKKLILNADKKLIEQVIINLITNALYAFRNQENKTITLTTKVTEKHIILMVADNGPGIEKDKINQIFIPFFSTKKEGTGIGLSLSKNIMRAHFGQINVISAPFQETKFSLSFPNTPFAPKEENRNTLE